MVLYGDFFMAPTVDVRHSGSRIIMRGHELN